MFYNISKPLQEEDSCFKKGRNLTTDTYTDYDYASLMNDRRSTSSYYVFLCGNLVAWRSKKQSAVARSSIEIKFRASTREICELL